MKNKLSKRIPNSVALFATPIKQNINSSFALESHADCLHVKASEADAAGFYVTGARLRNIAREAEVKAFAYRRTAEQQEGRARMDIHIQPNEFTHRRAFLSKM